ncbi:MAG: hypothetical protein ACD_2C00121G0003 [uncultured bacterium (gcode 4)]|uniref:Uncharacterized protein n=1 Tax=uncultured bacterium (gcode 4) TaxID=1234023 RepID=K2H1I6_9BACT|nr:MAG: hypothetical protein ACD_2C00121G0003 [uncultured bacterium (gcode 4)]
MENNEAKELNALKLILIKKYKWLDRLKTYKLWKVSNSVYADSFDWINVTSFIDKKWETIFHVDPVRSAHYFKKALYLAWYKEIKDASWIYNLYLIKNIDTKTWNAILWSKPLDKHSLEYFRAWHDIIFHEDKLWLETYKRPSLEWNLHKPQDWQLEWYIWSWALRIKDLHTLLMQKQIDRKIFDKFLPSLQKLLLTQIWDTRFEALWDYVTEQEIKDYYEGWYISKDLAMECYKKIKERDSIKQRKEKRKKEIRSKTHEWVNSIYG